jgi:hypothetical protein
VSLVNEQDRVVAPGDLVELRQWGRVTQDRVDGLDDDHRPGLAACAQDPLDVGGVVVTGDRDLCPGQPGCVNERGMDVGVRDDQGVGAGQGGNRTEVGVITGGEHQCTAGLEQLGQGALELVVDRQGAGDQP